jgi:DNA invertase Pin-like site-specific DNA recombinase
MILGRQMRKLERETKHRRVIELWNQGLNGKLIAKRLYISDQLVYRILNINGMKHEAGTPLRQSFGPEVSGDATWHTRAHFIEHGGD